MFFNCLSKDNIMCKKRFESFEENSKQNQIKMVTLFGQQVSYLDINQTPVNEPVLNRNQYFFQDLNIPYTEETSSEKSGLDDATPICFGDVNEKLGKTSPASCCTAENNSRTEQEDLCEVTQMAAECLVQISAVSLDQSQNFRIKHGSRSQDHQEFLNKPEMGIEEAGPCDSYELHTLGISETSPEEGLSCVSSKAIDRFSNKKEGGVKLRRGRRMKNFQKEILPALVSLSRHEIREDINILETVLRSREFKKMHGKSRDDKCKTSQRNNKDSTKRCVGRRRET